MESWSKLDGLQKYNFVLFVVHVILTVVFIFYFRKVNGSKTNPDGINLSLYEHVFDYDPTSKTFQAFNKESVKLQDWSISGLIITFFAITASFHLFYALNPGNVYLNAVKNGNNYFRWIEYSVTATMMMVIIAALSGVKDLQNYFLLITNAFAMIWTGQWFEKSQGESRWVPIVVGFVLLMGAFQIILTSFNLRIQEAQDAGFSLPGWLWMIVIVMFVFYASFGFVPIVQTIRGGPYRTYEKAYLTLSLASKATLGILVGYGFGQRTQAENQN